MSEQVPPPEPHPGLIAARRRRLSDDDIRAAMLEAGIRYVRSQQGLTVSLEHLNYEAIMAASNVSRSSVYRIWRYKEEYFVDLLTALGRPSWLPPEKMNGPKTWENLDRVAAVVGDYPDPVLRRAVFLRAARTQIDISVSALGESKEFRTYISVAAILASSSRQTRQGIVLHDWQASARPEWMQDRYKVLLALVGFRVRDGLTLDGFLDAMAACLEGFITRKLTAPEVVAGTFRLDVGAGEEEWSLGMVVFMGLFDTFLEPDPDWNAEQAVAEYRVRRAKSLSSQSDSGRTK